MLIGVKQRVAPTNQAQKLELSNQYHKMKMPPRNQDLETWLQQWEKVYKKCKDLKLPDVEGDRPLYSFLNAISTTAPEFSNIWMINIPLFDG